MPSVSLEFPSANGRSAVEVYAYVGDTSKVFSIGWDANDDRWNGVDLTEDQVRELVLLATTWLEVDVPVVCASHT